MRIAVVVLILLAFITGCTCQCNEVERNKTIIKKSFEILNHRQYEKLGTVIAEDYRRYCQATPDVIVENLDTFKLLLKRWDQEVPDGIFTLQKVISEGDLVAVWGTYSGTQQGPMGTFPATGKKLVSNFGAFFRIEEGKIAETWITWDNLAILNQLGLFPSP